VPLPLFASRRQNITQMCCAQHKISISQAPLVKPDLKWQNYFKSKVEVRGQAGRYKEMLEIRQVNIRKLFTLPLLECELAIHSLPRVSAPVIAR